MHTRPLFVPLALQVLKCSSGTQVLPCGGKSTPQWKLDQRVSRLPLNADMNTLVATTMAKYSCTEGVVVKRRSCFKTWLAMILVCESMIIILPSLRKGFLLNICSEVWYVVLP